MNLLQKLLWTGAACALSAACQPTTAGEGVINSQRQPILGGERVQVGDFPSVVAIVTEFGGGAFSACTGTLITPRVVLTAAHCVDPVTLQLPSQEVVTASTSVLFDADVINEGFQGEGFFVAAADTIPNPGFNIADLGDDDIAIVVLAEAVDDREPTPLELNPERNLIGENTVQVGFGIFDQFGNSGTEFVITDQPVANCGNLFGGSNNLLVCFDQSNGQGKCNGDSGGPTFDSNGVQLGVTSFGDPGCVDFGADTRISAEADFLASAINPTEECGEDGTCNPNCGLATLPNDPDCEVEEGRCSVSPASDSSSVFASLVGVFVALFVARRRRN